MPNCPQCNQLVGAEAIRCPHCKTLLKAFGHPGIPLHQATAQTYLCDNCLYHEDDTCTFPQRPYAKTCTLYCDRAQPPENQLEPPVYRLRGLTGFKAWCFRYRGILVLLVLIGASLWLALN
ncbi:MAG: zinc ribbon domain-containing protein [Cyanobacteriota bacterium]|nr:zinc ribbon domain-containing protein [Cyanobacteriota bacterium]